MTVDPFDELERQLRGRVAEARGKRRSRWRAHPFLAVLAVGAVTASGVAVAATGLRRGPDDKERGQKIAFSVMQQAEHDHACKSPHSVKDSPISLVDAAPPEFVLDALPFLRKPAPAGEQERGIRILNASHPIGGTVVLRSSIRIVRLSARWSVLTRLERGGAGFTVHDPAACTALRDRLLEPRLAGEGPGVREEARRVLDRDTRVNPEAMTLWFLLLTNGRPYGGTGQPVLPGPGTGVGHEVHRGLVMSGSGSRAKTSSYVGLTDPDTVRMQVWSKRADVRARLPKTVSVHQGFWRVEIPRHTGPVRLTEIAPDGSKGRVVRLRG